MTRIKEAHRILLVDPFYGGSHRQWGETLTEHSRHRFTRLTLEGKSWKWRMRGGSIVLADRYLNEGHQADLILCTSMLDLPSFIALLLRSGERIPPVMLYCHENQLLYPLPNEHDPRFKEQRKEFGSMNWRSALVADRVLFNSEFHRTQAIKAFEDLIRQAPDHNEFDALQHLKEGSGVYPPAPDLLGTPSGSRDGEEEVKAPVLLWNHRWEAEKGPEEFVRIVSQLMEERTELELMLLGASGSGEKYRQELKEKYPERVLKAEAASSREAYLQALDRCDLTLVTSHQDFFGISVVEAMYHGVVPVLPDRLAYPEHLPPEWKVDLLFTNSREAKERALAVIDKRVRISKEELRSSVEGYDVRNWIDAFDDELSELVRTSIR